MRRSVTRAKRPRRDGSAATVAGLLVLGLVGALAGCASDASTDAAEAPAGTVIVTTTDVDAPGSGAQGDPSSAEPTAAPTGDAVPELLRWTAPLLGGGEISGAALADRPLMLWFWAPT